LSSKNQYKICFPPTKSCKKSLVATVGQKWCCFTEIKKLEAFDFIGFQLPWSIADSKGFETIQINRFHPTFFLYKNALLSLYIPFIFANSCCKGTALSKRLQSPFLSSVVFQKRRRIIKRPSCIHPDKIAKPL